MSTAPRRVEDAVPAPAAAPSKGKNKPGSRFWHQGFIVQNRPGGACVPFMRRETAERVAGAAARATKIPMTVGHDPDGDYWFYTPAAEAPAVPAQREEAPDA